MQKYYLKSLQMIKNLNIRNKKEYNKLLSDYLLLNVESLKYYAQMLMSIRNCTKI